MNKRQLLCRLLLFFLAIVVQQVAIGQTRKISGSIKDDKGNPIAGASVETTKTPGNTTLGTVTDAQGNFSLTIDASCKILRITSLSYSSREMSIGSKSVFDISLLKSETVNMSDVIVVAYGQQKKASVTGAISTVSAKEIVQSPVTNLSNALAGRLPGLISVQSSGKPGSDASTLYIRGVGTYAGGTSPLIMVDGIVRDSYNDIDPNEVDNISILKDASATAVFGVRGANGVILINTKRGKEGATKVSATFQTAATQFTRLPKYVNAWQYATLRNEQAWEKMWQTLGNEFDVLGQENGWATFEKLRMAQYKPYKTDEDLKYYQNAHTPTLEDGSRNPYYDPYFHPDNNWQDQLYKKYGPQTQANVNMTGGTKSMKYFLSAGYLTQGGLFNTDYMPFSREMDYRKNRYNVRGNFDFDVNDNFKININVGTQFVQVTGMDNDGYNYQKNLMWTNPMASPGYINGRFVFIERQEEEQNNPLYSMVLRNKYNINDQSTLNSSIGLTHKLDFITKGLSINAKGSYDSYFASVSEGQSYPVVWVVRPNSNGDNLDPIWLQKGNETPSSRSLNKYKGKWRTWYTELALNYNRTFGDHTITGLAMGNLSKKFDPGLKYNLPHAYQSLVGRVTYAYKDKYLAEFNMGYNGSENFPEGQRFGFFPAYSLGWVASKENFWPENDYVTFFKVRGSLGKVGNDDVKSERYLYLPDVWAYNDSVGRGYNFGQYGNDRNYTRAALESKLGNPNVTWETSQKANIGFEASLFKDKVSITYDHYTEHRKDILSPRGTIPGIVAATLPAYNLGEVKNWGNELEVTYRDRAGKNWNYWVKANIANNNNRIVFRDEAIAPGLEYQAATGKPIDQGLLYQTDGLYSSWKELYEVDGNNNPILSKPIPAKGRDGKPYYNADNFMVYQRDLNLGSSPLQHVWNHLQPGDLKLLDINYDGVIDEKDRVKSGYTKIPQITYGISFGFGYKGFDMSILLQGAAKVAANPMVNTNLHFTGTSDALWEVDWTRFTPERYAAGEDINFPIAAYNTNAYQSTYFNLSTSYLRLKNMEVGYTFQRGLLNKAGIGSVRVYVNGFNLYTWTKNKIWGDPENQGTMGYGLTRTYNAGFKIGF